MSSIKNDRVTREPIKRSALRAKLGLCYYSIRRKLLWLKMNRHFSCYRSKENLEYVCFSHKTPLLRRLKDVDMKLQYNKITNLRLASEKLNGVVIKPGEIFSYWKLIGKPCASKGYLEGMVLKGGKVLSGVGGGLCQLSNLIFWMALHTPLTVIERHHHGYDVFPDSNRTQPFGSGATCYYPHGDLMIMNNTTNTYQLQIGVGKEYLEGSICCDSANHCRYEIVEKNHYMRGEYWGGYSRHNELYRKIFDLNGNLIAEELIIKNAALMMYSPFLDDHSTQKA